MVGPNGAGKSTFLDVLAGARELAGGTVSRGETVKLGYYKQRGLDLSGGRGATTAIEFVQQEVEKADPSTEGTSVGAERRRRRTPSSTYNAHPPSPLP